MFTFRLHPLYDMDGDIGAGNESASLSESPSVAAEVNTSGDGNALSPVTEADVSKQESFAKRLAEERAKVEAEFAPYKEVAEYFRETNGFDDVLTLKERIEMERLQDRAEQQGISTELQQRLEALEQRATKGDVLEQQMQEGERVSTYFSALDEFVKEKGVESAKLNQFMIDNGLTYDPANMEKGFTIAYKAMMHDELASKVESAQKDGVKNFLKAKGSIPTVPGTNSQGQVAAPAAKTWAEARQRANARDFSQI